MAAMAVAASPQPPLASTPSFAAGPMTSRTAATRAKSASASRPTFTFIARKPWPSAQRAIAAACSGGRPETDHFVATWSRTLPPSSS